MTQHFESKFKGLVGSAYKQSYQTLGLKRTAGLSAYLKYLTYQLITNQATLSSGFFLRVTLAGTSQILSFFT